jgi:hypothetical protein
MMRGFSLDADRITQQDIYISSISDAFLSYLAAIFAIYVTLSLIRVHAQNSVSKVSWWGGIGATIKTGMNAILLFTLFLSIITLTVNVEEFVRGLAEDKSIIEQVKILSVIIIFSVLLFGASSFTFARYILNSQIGILAKKNKCSPSTLPGFINGYKLPFTALKATFSRRDEYALLVLFITLKVFSAMLIAKEVAFIQSALSAIATVCIILFFSRTYHREINSIGVNTNMTQQNTI